MRTFSHLCIFFSYNASMKNFHKGSYPLKIPTSEYPHFSDRLKIAMQIRDCSVEELAAASFVTKSAIYGYRQGLRSPDVEILRLLAKQLDVSADFLLGLCEDIYV